MSAPVRIPRRIDDPPHLLLWSMDELVPLLFCMVLGVMAGSLGPCLLIGILITRGYRKFRDSKPDGYLLHLLYWVGVFTLSKAKSMKNPFIRKYLP